MRIGVPREIKPQERRVALVPDAVGDLTASGHEVLIEAGAGIGSSFPDAEYAAAGAEIVDSADGVWGRSELILKVKEPVALSSTGCSAARRSSPICTWPRPGSARTGCSRAVSPPSRTRPCRARTGNCRCSRR